MDRLSTILNRLSISAGVFFSGEMCGIQNFDGTEQKEGHIHLIESGRMEVMSADREVITLDKPSLIFFPRPKTHRLWVKESDMVSMVCASIRYGADTSNPLTNALPEMVVLEFEQDDYVAATAQGLFKEAFSEREGKHLLMDKLTEIIVVNLLRNVLENGRFNGGVLAGLAHKQLCNVIVKIHETPHEHWTLESMSALAFMSRSKFADEFKQIVGQTPGDYLIDWRISVAQNELKKGKPIAVIANEVGYENTSALSKAFRKKTGLSPTQWLDKYISSLS